MVRIARTAIGVAAGVVMLLAAGAANASTPAGVYQGCTFQACSMSTGECCRLAAQQEAACRKTDAANAPNYSAHGKQGAKAHKEISKCTRCSGVFLQTFCKK